MINKALSRNDVLFVVSSVLIYVVIVLALPSYTPLIEPDSATYITFESFRPAYYPAFLALCRTFGFDLIATTWIQLGIFALALFYLLITLLRCGFPRIGLALVVGILASNILFSSFHRSILTESLYFSLGLIALSGGLITFTLGGWWPLQLQAWVLA